jgi:hypothetical protein
MFIFEKYHFITKSEDICTERRKGTLFKLVMVQSI